MRQWKVRSKHEQPLVLEERSPQDLARARFESACMPPLSILRDQLLLTGRYPIATEAVVPLSDGAGEAIGIGLGVTRVEVGHRVIATTITNWIDGRFDPSMAAGSIGSRATDGWLRRSSYRKRLSSEFRTRFPYAAAATLPCAGVTAWKRGHRDCPHRTRRIDLALGTGGVSMFAVQIAKLGRAQALVTSSSDVKLERAYACGADLGANHRTYPAWETRVRELTRRTGSRSRGRERRHCASRSRRRVTVGPSLWWGCSRCSLRAGCNRMAIERPPRFGATVTPILMGNRRMLTRMVDAFARHRIEPVIDREFSSMTRRPRTDAFGRSEPCRQDRDHDRDRARIARSTPNLAAVDAAAEITGRPLPCLPRAASAASSPPWFQLLARRACGSSRPPRIDTRRNNIISDSSVIVA